MTTFDDPNRESVGLSPIWTGAGETTEPPTEETDLPVDDDDDEPEENEPYDDGADAPS